MDVETSFSARFLRELRALGLGGADARLLVALSGGCDSVALLHLLRFRTGPAGALPSAAHFDHAMRPESGRDADWVRGLCRAWEVPLLIQRAETAPRSETAAREARLRFLRQAAERAGADWIVTAHHADDQAETVLFRILRGTGIHGLRGIQPKTELGFARPLLRFWRAEIEGYARSHGLRWRRDASNRTLGPVRNRLRQVVIPEIERIVAPRARRNLVRLATLAAEAEAGWAAALDAAEREAVRAESGGIVLARRSFRHYHPALASRLLRRLLRRFGITPDRAGTTLALQFITDAPSGRVLELSGGLRLRTEFDEVRIAADAGAEPDQPLVIAAVSEPGSGLARIGGRRFRVEWKLRGERDEPSRDGWSERFDRRVLVEPLVVRGWRAGDRIRLAGGSRRLKKLFSDRRVPVSERTALPLLVDGAGAVHWVAGVARSSHSLPRPLEDAFHIEIVHG
jgi:tRNA(Ile)-lysidine synthase